MHVPRLNCASLIRSALWFPPTRKAEPIRSPTTYSDPLIPILPFQSDTDESASTALRPRSGTTELQSDRCREGADHVTARCVKSDPGTRTRARRRYLRAPWQADTRFD